MRIIVVGNGLAGTMFAKFVRDHDRSVEIDVFGAEKYLYYPRPNLIEFLAGNLPLERMFAFPEEWYSKQNIRVHLELPVDKILPEKQEIETQGGKREKYDVLLLASGSNAFLPPLPGVDKKGVFTLRTLDDAFSILDYLQDPRKVAVIGGGLLGLEAARALKTRGAEVEVVEFFPYLLPRQLDPRGGEILKAKIEKMGIKVHLGLATEDILGTDEVEGLRFKGGGVLKAGAALVAAGVRPNIALGREAGLETDKGIVVDDLLRTSNLRIYAAGDNLQHRGRWYGIIPASFDQAKVAAANALGQEQKYQGTVPSNTLKIAGLLITSIGLINPEKGACEEIFKEKEGEDIYKKIVIQEGKAVGAIWMGTKKGASEISRLITQKANVDKWKASLLDEDFDFSVL